jgi:hypothetical protein
MDILTLFVTGASNETISKYLEIDIQWVDEAVLSVFETSGWEYDLPISPYKIFKEFFVRTGQYPTEEEYIKEVEFALPSTSLDVKQMYKYCLSYALMEDRLEYEWI